MACFATCFATARVREMHISRYFGITRFPFPHRARAVEILIPVKSFRFPTLSLEAPLMRDVIAPDFNWTYMDNSRL